MESVTLKNIQQLLKDAPESVLEKVLDYIEAILKDESNTFTLSEEQKESLRKIKKRPYEQHTEIDTFLNEMKSKYDIYSINSRSFSCLHDSQIAINLFS